MAQDPMYANNRKPVYAGKQKQLKNNGAKVALEGMKESWLLSISWKYIENLFHGLPQNTPKKQRLRHGN